MHNVALNLFFPLPSFVIQHRRRYFPQRSSSSSNDKRLPPSLIKSNKNVFRRQIGEIFLYLLQKTQTPLKASAPFYLQQKSPVSAEHNMGLCPCTSICVCVCVCVFVFGARVCVEVGYESQRLPWRRHRELGVEQALRETSPLFV